MLVIKGNAGKSLAVREHVLKIKKQEKVLIIDREGLNMNRILTDFNTNDHAEIFVYTMGDEELDGFLHSLKQSIKRSGRTYKHVVFYLNVREDEIQQFKNFELETNVRAVLTVQTHDRDNPKPIEKVIV